MKKFMNGLVDNHREHTTREIVMLIIMCLLFVFTMYTSLESQDRNKKSYELQTTHNELVNDYNELSTKSKKQHELILRIIDENNRVKEENEQLKFELAQWTALVNATFDVETGNGTSYLWKHHFNAGGIKLTDTEYRSYANEEEGLKVLKSLLREYVETYGYNLKSIRARYCYQCGEQDLQTFTELFIEHGGKLWTCKKLSNY